MCLHRIYFNPPSSPPRRFIAVPKTHDMMTCMEATWARRNFHPMLLSWNSEKDLPAIQAALAVEREKKLSDYREARTAKWREEVKARGSFC